MNFNLKTFKKNRLAVIGTGYVGLVSGACFAETGKQVLCIDKDQHKIKSLQSGVVPIYEPGLSDMVCRNLKKNNLSFGTSIQKAVEENDIIFIAVGTPQDEDGSADLSHVKSVALEIAQHVKGYKIVVNKSTVPVGTVEMIEKLIIRESNQKVDLVSNPEFLKEGSAIKDFLKPDRIVIGTKSQFALERIEELYQPFMINGHPIFKMDPRSAELTKYASNALLATKITFINQIANLCDVIGADVQQVRRGMISDERIGPHFLYPGIGYGGSCFPKDVKAMIKTAEEYGIDFTLLKTVDQKNTEQKFSIIKKIIQRYGENLDGKTFSIWGLAFKPETDDLREAPSNIIIEEILSRGGRIKAHDPIAIGAAKKKWQDQIDYFTDHYQAADHSDALILATEWMLYRQIDFHYLKQKMKFPVIFDGRNLWVNKIENFPFDWYGIGVPAQLNHTRKVG